MFFGVNCSFKEATGPLFCQLLFTGSVAELNHGFARYICTFHTNRIQISEVMCCMSLVCHAGRGRGDATAAKLDIYDRNIKLSTLFIFVAPKTGILRQHMMFSRDLPSGFCAWT